MCRYGNQHTLAVNLVAMKIRSFFGLKKVKNQTHCEVLENLGCSYHVCGVVCLLLQWWMIFGAVIGQIGNSGSPIVIELILRILAVEPVKYYVHGFGAFGDSSIVCDSISGRVVHLEG